MTLEEVAEGGMSDDDITAEIVTGCPCEICDDPRWAVLVIVDDARDAITVAHAFLEAGRSVEIRVPSR